MVKKIQAAQADMDDEGWSNISVRACRAAGIPDNLDVGICSSLCVYLVQMLQLGMDAYLYALGETRHKHAHVSLWIVVVDYRYWPSLIGQSWLVGPIWDVKLIYWFKRGVIVFHHVAQCTHGYLNDIFLGFRFGIVWFLFLLSCPFTIPSPTTVVLGGSTAMQSKQYHWRVHTKP